ncbi:nucleotidyltransferase domain-containing protein [Nitrincola sp. MINF-07-Sa-05]|uniref:nucleotidyltransferase domain-containing protein n=1 Tax=Nitrincola salilacus TaxID=3400273 RepID=UPI0039181C8F
MIMDNYHNIGQASRFTGSKLDCLREKINEALTHSEHRNNITVVTTGSYGRAEATEESDLDWFIIFDRDLPGDVIAAEIEAIDKTIKEEITNETGDTGTFGQEAIACFSDMLKNIGGQQDTNETMTRRLLFLLEGTWLYGNGRFYDYRRQLLERYIKRSSPDEQIPRFLLNDIIRYYRTIATDFEFKTTENQKPWGLRNIKLRFSRKLLYFSGIIVAAELSGLDWEGKVARAIELFDLTALRRIAKLGDGQFATEDIFTTYESFIEKLTLPDIRSALENVSKESRLDSPEYVELRGIGHDFSRALHDWLKEKYPKDHPIHHALVF